MAAIAILQLLESVSYFTNAATLPAEHLSLRDETPQTQEQFDETTRKFRAEGLCRTYLDLADDKATEITTCEVKCGNLVKNGPGPEKPGSPGCIKNSAIGSDMTDPDGNKYSPGDCSCEIPRTDQVVDATHLILPVIDDIGCPFVYQAFDDILNKGPAAIQQKELSMDVGMTASIEAAKTIADSGKEADSFLDWLDQPCEVGNYTEDITKIFNPLCDAKHPANPDDDSETSKDKDKRSPRGGIGRVLGQTIGKLIPGKKKPAPAPPKAAPPKPAAPEPAVPKPNKASHPAPPAKPAQKAENNGQAAQAGEKPGPAAEPMKDPLAAGPVSANDAEVAADPLAKVAPPNQLTGNNPMAANGGSARANAAGSRVLGGSDSLAATQDGPLTDTAGSQELVGSDSLGATEDSLLAGGSQQLGGSDSLTGGSQQLGGSDSLAGGLQQLGGSDSLAGGSQQLGESNSLTGGSQQLGGSDSLVGGSQQLGGSDSLAATQNSLLAGGSQQLGGSGSLAGGSQQLGVDDTLATEQGAGAAVADGSISDNTGSLLRRAKAADLAQQATAPKAGGSVQQGTAPKAAAGSAQQGIAPKAVSGSAQQATAPKVADLAQQATAPKAGGSVQQGTAPKAAAGSAQQATAPKVAGSAQQGTAPKAVAGTAQQATAPKVAGSAQQATAPKAAAGSVQQGTAPKAVAGSAQQATAPKVAGSAQQGSVPKAVAGTAQQATAPKVAGSAQQGTAPKAVAGTAQQATAPKVAGSAQQGSVPKAAGSAQQATAPKAAAVGQEDSSAPSEAMMKCNLEPQDGSAGMATDTDVVKRALPEISMQQVSDLGNSYVGFVETDEHVDCAQLYQYAREGYNQVCEFPGIFNGNIMVAALFLKGVGVVVASKPRSSLDVSGITVDTELRQLAQTHYPTYYNEVVNRQHFASTDSLAVWHAEDLALIYGAIKWARESGNPPTTFDWNAQIVAYGIYNVGGRPGPKPPCGPVNEEAADMQPSCSKVLRLLEVTAYFQK